MFIDVNYVDAGVLLLFIGDARRTKTNYWTSIEYRHFLINLGYMQSGVFQKYTEHCESVNQPTFHVFRHFSQVPQYCK